MVVRTKLIDDLILTSVQDNCDCVVNLAAGFDTRPYRLQLPPSLDWIEADLEEMIDEKKKLLAGETPVCRLRREKVDLTNATERADFLSTVGRTAKRVLVITEGLLVYLDEKTVRSIAEDMATCDSIHWWILDIASPAILHMMRRGMRGHFSEAPLKFAPSNGVAFFENLGWKAVDIHSLLREAIRLRRVPRFLRLFSFFPDPDPRSPGRARWSAIIRLKYGQSRSATAI